MKFPRLKTIFLAPFVLFAVLYVGLAILNAVSNRPIEPHDGAFARHDTVAIFGASGTAGDGILKAAIQDPDTREIRVVTRRVTLRMDEGVASGKVQVIRHMDYLDYSAIREQIADVDAVYWALGTSSVGVDEETYGMIHVDFPLQFVTEWMKVSKKPQISFHYISSSDISEDSSMMWAREKFRAETTLFAFAEGSKLRVIAYRPDYIGPTEEEAAFGQDLLYWFFAPVSAAVRALQIGQAMIEVTGRGDEFSNGARVGTRSIVRYSDAYERRRQN